MTITSLHFTSLHFTSLHFTTHKYPSRFATLHCTTLHLISLHFTTLLILTHPQFLQFTTLITSLTLFLKAFCLQGKFPKISAGNPFQSWMVLFTKKHFLITILCLLFLVFGSWSTLLILMGSCNLKPLTFHACSPKYALKRAHMRDIFLRSHSISQFDSLYDVHNKFYPKNTINVNK